MPEEICKKRLRINETLATLIAAARFFHLAEREVERLQSQIRSYIRRDPHFHHSLAPLPVARDAPDIVRRMAAAAARMNVGPMAAVAGAIAQCTVEALLDAGAKHVVFDNGGDIVMRIDRPVVVGIFTGPAKIRDIGLRFEPRPDSFSVCTSSGTVGHSLSFGVADAATVLASDGFLADAAATALGNRVTEQTPAAMEAAIDELSSSGAEGMLVVAGRHLGVGGRLPEMIRVPVQASMASQ